MHGMHGMKYSATVGEQTCLGLSLTPSKQGVLKADPPAGRLEVLVAVHKQGLQWILARTARDVMSARFTTCGNPNGFL